MSAVILVLGDDVSTDILYPGRFMATVLPAETPRFAFADLPAFNAKLAGGGFPPGSIVAAGRNFGCGSSREQAVSCLRGHDLVIAAKSFSRIFLQNAVNLGLPCLICPTLETAEGDDLEIGAEAIVDRSSGRSMALVALPPARLAIMEAGGLIAYTRRRLLAERMPLPSRGVPGG